MPRKEQGWITFQSSGEERRILEKLCKQTQRTKTDILREMIRNMGQQALLQTHDIIDTDIESSSQEILNEETLKSMPIATLASVQLSARNLLRAKVKRIMKDRVNVEVILAIAPGVELVAIVTRTSADKLGLIQGKEVFAVIKSSSIMIAACES